MNHSRVLRLLREWKLVCRPLRKRRPSTTQADPTVAHAEHLLRAEHITPTAPDQVGVGDGIEGQHGDGTLVCGHAAGWLFSQMRRLGQRQKYDTSVTLAALNQALGQRQPPSGLLHHPDRGSTDTSAAYQQRLAQVGARLSHSRLGRPQEHGMAESCTKTIR